MSVDTKQKLEHEKFENFIYSFGATRLLLQKAYENGSLLEGLVLYAALVDGFCRIAIVLEEQIKNKSNNINESYIYQDNENDYYSERKIFKIAYRKKIINKDLYKEINTLYNIRNKAIHRFFVSEIEYSHLEIVLKRFECVYQELYKIVYDLESKQIKKKIGMTVLGKFSEADKDKIKKGIYKKKIKSGSERNLAKTLGCISVEEIVELASQNGLLQKCKKCGHLKIEHFNMEDFQKEKKSIIDLNDYLGACRAKGCQCEKYEKSLNFE